jgi:hypothetical protein
MARKSATPGGGSRRKPRQPRARKAPPAGGPPPPAPPWDAPLDGLDRDALSAFVYQALLPAQTADTVRDLGLSLPGFRREALGEVQRADLIADEIRANPAARDALLDVLRADFREPPLAHLGIDPRAASELLALLDHEDAVPLTLWRLLSDPDPAVRDLGARYLADLARDLYGEPGAPRPTPREQASPEQRLAEAEQRAADLERRLAAAREELATAKRDAEARLESARRKGEEAREKLQEWLKEARARESAAREELARAREAADAARREAERAGAELAAARAQDLAQELHRARADARELGGKVTSLEARLERARAREAQLEADAEAARSRAASATGGTPAPAAEEGEDEADAATTWLFPIYTREFYDSLDGWDRRIQRAAFKQAALLAQDHRHPSLRALPLEGLPNYYRVRVATDVRLLYRRAERQNTVEILSVIDREDLDRYIKQAKTR